MIIKDVVEYVNDNITNFASVYVDIIRQDTKSIAFRALSSNAESIMYFDGTIHGEFDIKILTASDSAEECIAQLDIYTDAFNIKNKLQLTDTITVSNGVSTSPVFDGIDERNRYHYSMTVSIQYIQNGGI